MAFFAPVTLIIVGNIVTFFLIIRSLLTSGTSITSVQKASDLKQARQGLAIMVLLGPTWVFGVLPIDNAKLTFQYLFCIFNALQGLFIFIFICILPAGTRRKLRNLIRKKTKVRNLGGQNVLNDCISNVCLPQIQLSSQ